MINKRVAAELLTISVGFLGTTAAVLSIYFQQPVDGWESNKLVAIPVSSVFGFVFCFLAFRAFLKAMKYRSWRYGFFYGPALCGIAGGATGIITGVSIGLAEIPEGWSESLSMVLVGIFAGCGQGLLYGIAAGLLLGAPLAIITEWLNITNLKKHLI